MPKKKQTHPAPSDLPLPEASKVPFRALRLWHRNPRPSASIGDLEELKDSILLQGVVQSLLVRPAADGFLDVGAGGRRLRALAMLVDEGKLAPEYMVPVNMVPAETSEAAFLELALVENLQRFDMNPIDEGGAFAELVKLAKKGAGATKAIARRIGKTQRYVQIRISLSAKLCDRAKDAVRSGEITLEQAKVLASRPAVEDQEAMLETLFEADPTDERTLALTEMVSQDLPSVRVAIFDLDDYSGEIFRPYGTDNEGYFLDVEEFTRLQQEATASRVRELETRFQWVRVIESQFYPPDLYRAADAAGAVVWVQPNGSVRVIENVEFEPHIQGEAPEKAVNLNLDGPEDGDEDGLDDRKEEYEVIRSSDGQPPPAAPPLHLVDTPPPSDPFSVAHRYNAQALKTSALQGGILEHPMDAIRLYCLAALDPTRSLTRIVSNFNVYGHSPVHAAVARLCISLNISWQDGSVKVKGSETELWNNLRQLPDDAVLQLAATLIAASTVSCGISAYQLKNSKPKPLIFQLAADLGVEHGTTELTEQYLHGFHRRDSLIAVAIGSGAFKEEDLPRLEKMTMPEIRAGILASKDINPRYVPPELVFQTDEQIYAQLVPPRTKRGKKSQA